MIRLIDSWYHDSSKSRVFYTESETVIRGATPN